MARTYNDAMAALARVSAAQMQVYAQITRAIEMLNNADTDYGKFLTEFSSLIALADAEITAGNDVAAWTSFKTMAEKCHKDMSADRAEIQAKRNALRDA